ncbi:vitamin K epoxide reductase family/thioredoxin domain-containing protein [Corallococcus coralloides]|uniref:Vitamin K epoxide reductase family/thioredoxin domain-containing protein n=1 Tax=Corallococcus coralloides TaxID=184914 RepID=A0A410S1Q1_CORCK|nr:vitamin K epoxide reductase family protein [Corallococcus coralloides]QAT88137.1 vitamin K epoxide reductase family/thioredoxin domain-containing protein [Corallococcus coralloides]
MSKKAPTPAAPVPTRGALALLVLGLLTSALAVYQWMELLTLRAGGATSCGINEHVNCETVWNSDFASAVHDTLGIPIAGLGLVWGLSAVGLAALYLAWAKAGRSVRPAASGLRLLALAGVISVAVFASVSASVGVVCPTCLGTYVLVLAFAGVAWRGLPAPLMPQAGEWGGTLQWTVGISAVAFVAMLMPGRATPHAPKAGAFLPPVASTQAQNTSGSNPGMPPPPPAPPTTLPEFIASLPQDQKQFLSDSLAMYRSGTPKLAAYPPRALYGPADAPVKVLEWTDSKCPHCKSLVEELALIKQHAPKGMLSVEARQFPLDGQCNPAIPNRGPDALSVRCAAARATVCLEGAKDFWALREKLFAAQAFLDTDKVMEIASSGSVARPQLEGCMTAPETIGKLRQDVEYAMRYNIQGTPLVLVNGREVPPSAPLIYALVLASGNPDAPAFSALPPPRARGTGAPGHEGHAHP